MVPTPQCCCRQSFRGAVIIRVPTEQVTAGGPGRFSVILGDPDTACKNGLCLESGNSLQMGQDLELEEETPPLEGERERTKK